MHRREKPEIIPISDRRSPRTRAGSSLPPVKEKGRGLLQKRIDELEAELELERARGRELELDVERVRAETNDQLATLSAVLLEALQADNAGQKNQVRIPNAALPGEGGEQARCWLHDSTCSRVPDGAGFGERMQVCSSCDAFNKVAPDPYSRLGEIMNSVLFLLQRRQEQFRDAQEALVQSEKLAGLGELAAGLAHEINTPTGIILARLDCMTMDGENPLPELVKEDLGVIRRHAERLRRITSSLTSFARRHKVEKRIVIVQELLSELLEITERLVQKGNVAVMVEMPEEAMAIYADGTMVQQVFMNMILNARDAMPAGGVLKIRGWREGADYHIEFRDTGIGMDEAVRKRVFDPFFTTKEAKGTGLGLSVSYGIIKDHRGRIEVESAPGAGAAFRIVLPRYSDHGIEGVL